MKVRCYWERFPGDVGPFGNLMGTHREADENKGKKQKNSSPFTFQKEKNWTPHESMLSLSLAA